jgi:hypothetical protein
MTKLLRISACLLAIFFSSVFIYETKAAVCALRSSSGACLVWKSGSTQAEFTVKGGTRAAINVTPIPALEGFSWIALCGNPGVNSYPAGGRQVVMGNETLAPYWATKDVTGSGPSVPVHISASLLTIPENREIIESYCNSGWVALAAVVCAFDGTASEQNINNGRVNDAVVQRCDLPDCETLGFSQTSVQEPPHFDERQYSCIDVEE